MTKNEAGDFVRDEVNNALINTNINAFNNYKQQRAYINKLQEQEATISDLKSEMDQMKQLLQKIIRENNGQNSI